MQRIERVREQLVIRHILRAGEQRVVAVNVPIGLGQPCRQHAPGQFVLVGESEQRGDAVRGILHARGGARFVAKGFKLFGALQPAMADLHRPGRGGRPGRAHAPRIEARLLDIPAILVGLAAAKG
ncbi:hypothetical protein D9M73_163900 [compost metagenome]